RVKGGAVGGLAAAVLGHNGGGVGRASGFGEGRDGGGGGQRADGFERDEFRIAGADADADEPAGAPGACAPRAHRPVLASALTAAAVMALPPMRPRTSRNGTPRESAASASFDSAAPTKPTGMPRIAAGFGAPASRSSSNPNSALA